MKQIRWLKILSKLRKPGIATQKKSLSTVSLDAYHKTLLDITDCQKSVFRRKSVVLVLVKIKQFIVLSNA